MQIGDAVEDADLLGAFRNLILMWTSHSMAIGGGGVLTIEMDGTTQFPLKFTGHMEWATYAIDMAVAAFLVFVPEAKVIEAGALSRLQSLTPKIADTIADKASDEARHDWIRRQLALADMTALGQYLAPLWAYANCAWQGSQGAIDYRQPLKGWITTTGHMADVVVDCGIDVLGKLLRSRVENIESILEGVKVVPEALEGQLALATAVLTASNFDPTQMRAYAGRSLKNFAIETDAFCLNNEHNTQLDFANPAWPQQIRSSGERIERAVVAMKAIEQPAGEWPLLAKHYAIGESNAAFAKLVADVAEQQGIEAGLELIQRSGPPIGNLSRQEFENIETWLSENGMPNC
jgi:hypothetical protein